MNLSMCVLYYVCIYNIHLRICYYIVYLRHTIYTLYTGAVGIKEICEDLNGTSSLVDEGDGVSVNLPIKWLILGPGEEIVAAIGQKYYYTLYTFINMIIHRLLYIINL